MKKYEITDIVHPDNPNLHRIRAVTDLTEDVLAGTLGGYVESYNNLDQEGRAWISEDAIACENAVVCGDAVLTDHAVAKGCAYVGKNATVMGDATVQDDAKPCAHRLLTAAPVYMAKFQAMLFAAAMPLSCPAPSSTTGRRTALSSKMTVFLCRQPAGHRPRKNPVPMILNDKTKGRCL